MRTARLFTVSRNIRPPLDADPLVMWPVMHAGKPTPRGQTNTCENITLPQTSFAGGNKVETCLLVIT